MSMLIRKTSYFYTIINDWYQIDPAESEKNEKNVCFSCFFMFSPTESLSLSF